MKATFDIFSRNEVTMAHSRLLASSLLAVLLAGAAAAQTPQPKRAPDVIFVPTTDAAVDAMLKLANIKKTDVVYDLGCGDGKIVIAAAKNYGARGVGIDIDPKRIAEANEAAKKAGVENLVKFIENDLFESDIKEASVVTIFLLPQLNLKLKPKLMQDLKPGTRIVSNTFDMGDWKAEKEVAVGTADGDQDYGLSKRVYLWTIPPRGAK
jgi:SAM-dependent methyltransferase